MAAHIKNPLHSFSIVIASARSNATVNRLIEALVRQNYPADHFEIIVVQNAGARGFKHEKVSTYQSKIAGVSAARNLGIKQAKFSKIITLDDDCIVATDFLRRYDTAWKAHPQAVMIGGLVKVAEQNLTERQRQLLAALPWCFGKLDLGTQSLQLDWQGILYAANLSFDVTKIAPTTRGEVFERDLGRAIWQGWPQIGAEDWEFFVRNVAQKKAVWYEPTCVAINVVNEERFAFPYLWQRHWLAGIERQRLERHQPQFPKFTTEFWSELKNVRSWQLALLLLTQYLSYLVPNADTNPSAPAVPAD